MKLGEILVNQGLISEDMLAQALEEQKADGEKIGTTLIKMGFISEEELLKAQKLDSIGVLAGGIAHDFNNILAAIMGSISLVKMDLDGNDSVCRILSEAEKASGRATALTHQLLTFSKGGAPVKKTASIAEVIRESSDFALSGSGTGRIFCVPDDLWPVEIDVAQISQVIHNLIHNADQAMPEAGSPEYTGSVSAPTPLSSAQTHLAFPTSYFNT